MATKFIKIENHKDIEKIFSPNDISEEIFIKCSPKLTIFLENHLIERGFHFQVIKGGYLLIPLLKKEPIKDTHEYLNTSYLKKLIKLFLDVYDALKILFSRFLKIFLW
jgi:predicted transcriptional regulator of viral defense system